LEINDKRRRLMRVYLKSFPFLSSGEEMIYIPNPSYSFYHYSRTLPF
jgi:hypothetical protein